MGHVDAEATWEATWMPNAMYQNSIPQEWEPWERTNDKRQGTSYPPTRIRRIKKQLKGMEGLEAEEDMGCNRWRDMGVGGVTNVRRRTVDGG